MNRLKITISSYQGFLQMYLYNLLTTYFIAFKSKRKKKKKAKETLRTKNIPPANKERSSY